jgi:hypothetical protein
VDAGEARGYRRGRATHGGLWLWLWLEPSKPKSRVRGSEIRVCSCSARVQVHERTRGDERGPAKERVLWRAMIGSGSGFRFEERRSAPRRKTRTVGSSHAAGGGVGRSLPHPARLDPDEHPRARGRGRARGIPYDADVLMLQSSCPPQLLYHYQARAVSGRPPRVAMGESADSSPNGRPGACHSRDALCCTLSPNIGLPFVA